MTIGMDAIGMAVGSAADRGVQLEPEARALVGVDEVAVAAGTITTAP